MRVIRERRRNVRHIPREGEVVLVVDDSKTIRFALKKMLAQGGYEVLEAENGREAIKMARNHSPILIIMDIVMPELNGFQATRRIRKMEETRDIPIVIMSGNQEATEKFWVERIGANDFMSKPFSRKEVFQRLEWAVYRNQIA
ncbi:twitching motility two-component system response regulator PilH [Thiolapillus brandeum]|uniref:Twitching motility two-component system response regulator PilH n=1 Tax=Thiolapillus brandeum TaxID=1076588 RepID=A0A7U6GJA3_9GAMM|nr:twitching motility two-component system response regulator PilH [Thiolapillus brandeum]